MTTFATNKPILPCRFVDEAYETGKSDALFDGFESPMPCNCSQCRAAYAEGVAAGLAEIKQAKGDAE